MLRRRQVLGPLVRQTPGLRVPGHVDGNEIAVRAVLGQQVSVAGARTIAARLTAEHGTEIQTTVPGLTHLFPSMAATCPRSTRRTCRCRGHAAGP